MAMSDYSLSDIAAVSDGASRAGFGNNGDGWWIILLFILLGGWGGNRGWGGQGGGAGGVGGNEIYPWLNQAEAVNGGFASVQQALCNGFAGVANGFAQAEVAANARQVADMQQAFAAQTAMMQGFNAQQAQLAQCCCDNRLATANLASDLAREACADRQAVADAMQAVSAQAAANTQRILDQMCQDKIDQKNDEIAQLRQQIVTMNLAASQNAQTQTILADNFAQTNALEQYLAPVPRPAYIVQNPNCCQQTCGCGA